MYRLSFNVQCSKFNDGVQVRFCIELICFDNAFEFVRVNILKSIDRIFGPWQKKITFYVFRFVFLETRGLFVSIEANNENISPYLECNN